MRVHQTVEELLFPQLDPQVEAHRKAAVQRVAQGIVAQEVLGLDLGTPALRRTERADAEPRGGLAGGAPCVEKEPDDESDGGAPAHRPQNLGPSLTKRLMPLRPVRGTAK